MEEIIPILTACINVEDKNIISNFLVDLASSYRLTDAYQTKELRDICTKNFIMEQIYLNAALYINNSDEIKNELKFIKESCEYHCECYEAFLSIDEIGGKYYSECECNEIKEFFFLKLKLIDEINKAINDFLSRMNGVMCTIFF